MKQIETLRALTVIALLGHGTPSFATIGCKVISRLTSATPSLKQGTEELQRYVRITRTTPERLANSQKALEQLTDEKATAFMATALAKLNGNISKPSVQANLEHVENQHLKPLTEDATELARTFKIAPEKLKLLMLAHDLGKVEIPQDMLAVLKTVFPTNFVAREILTHEYASMHWIDKLGKEAGLSPKEILAIQSLIANHNFGPSLTKPGNEELASHWWPTNFRTQLMPQLERLGVRTDEVFEKGSDGTSQYRNAEENVYSALLSAYDRAIANKHNFSGLSTWQKFAQQDYDAAAANPNTPSPFNGPGLAARMETSARWSRSEVQSLWKTLFNKHLPDGDKANQPSLESFAPYRRQVDGIDLLSKAIEAVKKDNPVAVQGSVNYKNSKGELFRVDDKKSPDGSAQLLKWNGSGFDKVKEDTSPVRLYFELLKSDLQ